jgi:hypothetical protein
MRIAGGGAITINAPDSGTALAVASVSGSLTAGFSGASSDAARIELKDGNAGNERYQIRSGGLATGAFDIFDATASRTVFAATSAGVPRLPSTASNTGAQSGYLCFSTTNGDITYDPTNTCLVSSRRYKQNITPLNTGLAEVMRLRPVSYELRPEYNPAHIGRQIGFIAEDVQKIESRLVPLDAEGKPRSVEYAQMSAMLVRAIQQQQQQIDALKKQIHHGNQ